MTDDLKLWFPLYVADILTSRRMRRWGADQIGIFMLLLFEQWVGGPLPNDKSELCDMARCPDWSKVDLVLQAQFALTDKGWINERLVEIWYEQMGKMRSKSRAGEIGAAARWGKKLLLKDTTVHATALPSDSDRKSDRIPGRNGNESRVEEITTLEGRTTEEPKTSDPKRHDSEENVILVRNGLKWGTVQHPEKRGYRKIAREYFEDLMFATKDDRTFPENLVIETQEELDTFLES